MRNVKHLECIKCGLRTDPVPQATLCPACGGLLEVIYDYDWIRSKIAPADFAGDRNPSIWRYRRFLPVEETSPGPALRVGGTPLYQPEALGEVIGLADLWIKDDGLNPTASLKDRASSLAAIKALEAGAKVVACASTGNAASSMAGNAASMGLSAWIFVPQRAPQGKVAQLLIFGANVVKVQGNYKDAFDLSARAIERYGWYNRNAAINPYLMEGKKTVSLEIAEQLDWSVPDWVVVSVGDGCTLAGVWKGFVDLYQTGFISRLPKLVGVQAEGSQAIARAFLDNQPLAPGEENTLADSIAVGVPRNPDKALKALRDSKGTVALVSDQEILDAMRVLGRQAGIFGEPAGVAGLAGLRKLVRDGIIGRTERVVAIVTGNGLKDPASAGLAAGQPLEIPPDLNQLTEAVTCWENESARKEPKRA